MDVPFTILITQVLAMLVMLSVGYVSYRAHLLSDAGVGDLANVVMYVASPAAMVTSFLGAFRMEKLVNAGACALLTIVILLMCALVARIFCGSEGRISRFGVIFSNTGFVGIPLVQSILGQEYVLYVTVCIAVSIFFVWTYGVYLVTGSFQEVSLAKVLTNPAVITLFLGFALFLLSVRLPDFLSVACSTLGSLNTGGAMIVLGCYLAQTRLGHMMRDLRIYKVSLLRLVVSPLLCCVLLWLLPVQLISADVKMVVLITFATPVGALCAMLSQKYGGNYEYGAGLVSLSTLLSLATMPLMLELGMMVLS